MAKRVVTLLVDDLDGQPIEDGSGATVQFGLNGKAYEIDLRNSNAELLYAALEPFVDKARSVGRGGGKKPKENVKEIRAWAQANGYEPSERGRIPQSVIAAYRAAHV
jgi:hypothetical protein